MEASENISMTYGDRLKVALAHTGKDRASLAAAIGVSVQSIGQVMLGDTKALTAENSARAARYLGVDGYWLATGEGQMQTSSGALSPHAQAMGQLFDKIPTSDPVKWAIVYQKVTQIIIEAIQAPPPIPEPDSRQETERAPRQSVPATRKTSK